MLGLTALGSDFIAGLGFRGLLPSNLSSLADFLGKSGAASVDHP